jgi:hypothetical protein
MRKVELHDGMTTVWLRCLLITATSVVSVDNVYAVDEPMPYTLIVPSGYSEGTDSGATAYTRKRRGDYDNEPMTVIEPYDRPSDLPPPTIIAPSSLPAVFEFTAGKVARKSDLKGEDAVFQRIYDDQEADRCVLNPQACAKEDAEKKKKRQFVPAGDLAPAPR